MPFAIILTGIRRCSKSTLLVQLTKNIPKFYYLNFDDTRLMDFDINDFDRLNETFFELYGDSNIYFFDEIQNIKNWEIFIKTLLDRNKNIILTGSDMSLLRPDTHLTGRHLNIELFPFSFNEMLKLKNEKASVENFNDYLLSGGFPEYLKYRDYRILNELFNDIIQRDIIAKYNIRNIKVIMELALYLLNNSGNEFSYNKLKNLFNLGSVNTVISFITYLEEAYILFSIPKFDYSLKKQIINNKKIYCVDNGMLHSNSLSFAEDQGKLLENLVFITLRKRYRDIFYFKDKFVCDFIIRDKGKVTNAFQVAYSLNEDNKKREINGLMSALKAFNLSEGIIFTYNYDDEFILEDKKIKIMSFWKYLLPAKL